MVEYSLFSNVGERDNNEDYVGMADESGKYCFVLCDGLGGHGKGEVASKHVVDTILAHFRQNHFDEDWLDNAIRNAQETLLKKQRDMNEINGMKTTLVVLEIDEDIAQYTYVGDSRGYYFYKNKYKCHTLDHSVPQMLVSSHQIKDKDIRNHPDRNRLLRVMGIEWDDDMFEYDKLIDIKEGKRQAFLLCSDGFWELIDEKDMEKCLKMAKSPNEWIALMQNIILQNGTGTNMDNYSAIAVICEV